MLDLQGWGTNHLSIVYVIVCIIVFLCIAHNTKMFVRFLSLDSNKRRFIIIIIIVIINININIIIIVFIVI